MFKYLLASLVSKEGKTNIGDNLQIKNDSTMLRLLGEVGFDMSRFPTKKHFVSWLGLSSKNKQSGKRNKSVKSKSNNAGLLFRLSAQSLLTSKHNAIGLFIRRLAGRKGIKVAIKAGAKKIAEAVLMP